MNYTQEYAKIRKEWLDFFAGIENKKYGELLHYFITLQKERYAMEAASESLSEVVILGNSFPEEVLLAYTDKVSWIFGGSFHTANMVDDLLPRDTDSTTKSMLGELYMKFEQRKKDILLLIPLTCDSMKKISNQLKKDWNVVPVELPSDKSDLIQVHHWEEEVERVSLLLEKHLKKRYTRSRFNEQYQISKQASEVWGKFVNVDRKYQVFSRTDYLFLANSWYWTNNKQQWIDEMTLLIKRIKRHKCYTPDRPNVLLIGSPIYAPNCKVPDLVDEVEINISNFVHPLFSHFQKSEIVDKGMRSKTSYLTYWAEKFLTEDISPAYTRNETYLQKLEELLNNNAVDGVVFHVLKGQIEYDFEYKQMDDIISKNNIPIFRLETDYNYQDIEQLRIRLEAFAEMLNHRNILIKRGA